MRGGTYQLLIRLERETRIRVGMLGIFLFPAGYYVYTGSALSGIDARIARHLSRAKRFHWHIDYLLEHAAILRYASKVSLTRRECEFNAATMAADGARVVAVGFGSSDCRCVSHLVYFAEEPPGLAVEIPGELDSDR
jgi:Uri superfamily endonuclease